jgi:hypothetical protein
MEYARRSEVDVGIDSRGKVRKLTHLIILTRDTVWNKGRDGRNQNDQMGQFSYLPTGVYPNVNPVVAGGYSSWPYMRHRLEQRKRRSERH